MDRTLVIGHLEQANHYVEQGARHIERQKELIASLEASNGNPASAKRELARFEEAHALHRSYRDWLEKELGGD